MTGGTRDDKWMDNALALGRGRLSGRYNEGKLTMEELKLRFDYTLRIESKYAEAIRLAKPRVFVSYSGRSKELGTRAYNVVRASKILDRDVGEQFLVENGFRANGEAEVRNQILLYLKRCCLFLGIMNREFRLDAAQAGDGDAVPAGWVLIEAGMAEALGMPVVLLVERGVHADYWLKPFKTWRHVEFNDARDFDGKLDLAVERLREQYRQLTSGARI